MHISLQCIVVTISQRLYLDYQGCTRVGNVGAVRTPPLFDKAIGNSMVCY